MLHGPLGQDTLEYLVSLAPLLALLSSIPTVEEACIGSLKWARPVLVQPSELLAHYHEVVLSKKSLQQHKWWTLLTYMFIHKDLDHLLSNLRSLLTNGWITFHGLGPLGTHAVFLASGALAGLNNWGRSLQAKSQIESSIPRAPERIGPMSVPEGARKWWDSVRQGTAKHAAPIVNARTEALGASGGVCGLMGYGLGATVCQLIQWSFLQRDTDGARRDRDRMPTIERLSLNADLLVSVHNAIQCGCFLVEEWRSARGESGLTGVDHSGHLTGFVAGAALAIASFVMQWPKHLNRTGRPMRLPWT
eukprot:TRINITY_DN88794_c0_g1_i1.p1 TRINITY_DN88794_c0_g1~~TRINITY_DN88794_c0_g1_i1.p1  ORF type:complete len:305 (-),score=24.75 TRINITY_DN88794_c0_g1_i1:172-1086(-)